MSRASRLLVISQDRLEGQVAGTSIRALELARALRDDADVTLAAVGEPPRDVDGMPCVGYHPQDPRALRGPLAATDAVLSLPQWPLFMRTLRRSRARLIFDLYVPEALETMGGFPGDRPGVRGLLTQFAVDRAIEALRAGDHLVCASEKQRDLWLGAMLAERLIGVCTPRRRPVAALADRRRAVRATRRARRGVRRGRAAPAIRGRDRARRRDRAVERRPVAVARSRDCDPGRRAARAPPPERPLVFMGAARQLPAQRTAERARALAAELGLLDRIVLFNDEWVPYEERADWLLEADCAFSTHDDHLETRFAFEHGCSTASGRACRSSARAATTSARWSNASASAPASRRATPRRRPARSRR